ncbi:isoprenylcysteine carboxyl methyltransferase family protein [Labrys wisconsinensis]|uniref:Methyltransferase n=1 Tax=Labrys wisconsinensis TaxID=425677 RepID=A0ABU0IZU4_9HYPH|nr:isoprenylcysteine carboxylmethyltransferase family protein [Labrys wisconsinensis]MDQ0467524.1 methyltransferase [Labrys wisconsinensis]
MTAPDPLGFAVLAFVTLERGAELALARRNTARLIRAGAVEHAAGHYPLIVVLHAAWLAGLWLLAWGTGPDLAWLVLFGLLQLLRAWTLATLGPRWTTRIIVSPGAPLVRRGPYRLLRHPNYAVVAGEILVLPLAFGLPLYAFAFSLANAAILLAVRVPAEERALAAARPGKVEP